MFSAPKKNSKNVMSMFTKGHSAAPATDPTGMRAEFFRAADPTGMRAEFKKAAAATTNKKGGKRRRTAHRRRTYKRKY